MIARTAIGTSEALPADTGVDGDSITANCSVAAPCAVRASRIGYQMSFVPSWICRELVTVGG